MLSDCWRKEERGTATAIYSLAPFLGPAVGPIGKSSTLRANPKLTTYSCRLFDPAFELALDLLGRLYSRCCGADTCVPVPARDIST